MLTSPPGAFLLFSDEAAAQESSRIKKRNSVSCRSSSGAPPPQAERIQLATSGHRAKPHTGTFLGIFILDLLKEAVFHPSASYEISRRAFPAQNGPHASPLAQWAEALHTQSHVSGDWSLAGPRQTVTVGLAPSASATASCDSTPWEPGCSFEAGLSFGHKVQPLP